MIFLRFLLHMTSMIVAVAAFVAAFIYIMNFQIIPLLIAILVLVAAANVVDATSPF